ALTRVSESPWPTTRRGYPHDTVRFGQRQTVVGAATRPRRTPSLSPAARAADGDCAARRHPPAATRQGPQRSPTPTNDRSRGPSVAAGLQGPARRAARPRPAAARGGRESVMSKPVDYHRAVFGDDGQGPRKGVLQPGVYYTPDADDQ